MASATKLLFCLTLICLWGSIFTAPRPNVVFASVGPAPIATRPTRPITSSASASPNLFRSLVQAIVQFG